MTDPHIEPAVLASYVDAGLSMAERYQVDRHLAACPQCVQELANTARTMRELIEASPPLVERIDAQELAARMFRQAVIGAVVTGVFGVLLVIGIWAWSEWQLRHG